MSRTIDEKVVEMRFDNRQFQSATAATMSTLDKLKASLRFDGATKGLENISSATKKIDMTGLGNAIEDVRMRFSALEVMGVTALANITNSAVNAGKKIISALTIDPLKTGFQEYETQMNAVQTILANTQSKGSTLEDVNAALAELNKYADQTIYNFTEMTRNIGTFTAAGVDLDKSVTSIKGIANLAAISGSNAQQASTAMYQLSQALAAGKVSLMDWNSVVNAGMGGEVFQTALKRTATQMGHNVDALIEKYGSFRESLTEGQWLTAEVLTETLTQLSGAYTEADLIAQGYTKEQAKQITELAQTAVDAATKVKTVTQLWDTMKEAVQSGWAQTWQLIFGDFEEAKFLFTDLSEFFGGFIEKTSSARNALLEGALGPKASWGDLTKQINDAGVATDDFEKKVIEVAKTQGIEIDKIIEKEGSLSAAFQNGALSSKLIVDTLKSFGETSKKAGESTEDMTAKLEYFQKVVDDVWYGSYKNGEERIKALSDAGYEYAQVQDLVNKTVDGHRLTLEDLSDAQLVSLGYTDEQIKKINALAEEAEKSGTSLNELITNLEKPSGRQLLIESLWNILHGVADILGTIKTAWQDAFPPMTSDQLYSIIEAVHDFTAAIKPSEETLDKLTRTFKGLFAILDIITTFVGGGFKAAFKVVSRVLGLANTDILSLTANLGDALVGIRDFITNNEIVNAVFDNLATAIVGSVKAVKGWVDAFLAIPEVQKAIIKFHNLIEQFANDAKNFVQNFVKNVANGLKSIPDLFDQIGQDTIQGFINGLKDKTATIPDILINLGKALLEAIKGVLGIHSPSTAMYDIGTNVIQGLINGISAGIDGVVAVVKGVASKIADVFSEVPWDSVVSAGLSLALIYLSTQLLRLIDSLGAPLRGLGNLLDGVGGVLESTSKVINSMAFSIRLNAIRNLAIGLAILAGSIFLLAQLDAGKLWGAIGAMAALAVIIGVLSVAISKFGPENSVKMGSFSLSLIGIASSILIMATAIKKLESLDPNKAAATIAGFAAIVASLAGILAIYGALIKGPAAKNISKVGSMMLQLSVSMLLMVAVIKLMSGLSLEEVTKGGLAISGFVGVIYLLAKSTKAFGTKDIAAFGKMLMQVSAAMLIMVATVKLMSGMSIGDIIKGEAAITGFVGIIYLLAKIVKNFGVSDATKLGASLMGISTAMVLLAAVTKIMSSMSVGDIVKGEAAVLGFVGIIKLMTTIVKTTGKDFAKIGPTLLAMSAAVAIMGATAVLLGKISIPGLVKGLSAITILGTVLALMIQSTRGATDVRNNLIVMSVAIGIMAASIAVLSFIDPLSLAGATAAMATLMGMFALIEHSSKYIKKSLATLIVMTAAVGALAGILVLLAGLPVENSLAAAGSLSMLMLSLSVMMKVVQTTGALALKAYASLGIMLLTVGGLADILGDLASMDVGPTLEIAKSLSMLLLSLSAACSILAVIGKVGSVAALQGALALDGVILIIGGLMVGIGALAKYYPQMEEFLDTGIVLLEKIGHGLGSFFGNIVGGFMSGVTSSLPAIADNMSSFMNNLQPFLDGASKIDPGIVDSIKSLAQMILILTAADLLNGIASFFGGESSLTKFAEQLVPFGKAMTEFSSTISGKIDETAVTAAANAGRTLSELAANIPKQGGLLQGFLGSQDLSKFGKQLVAFGEAMVDFSEVIVDGMDVGAVEAAANAGKTLVGLASNLPEQDGLLQSFLGNQDLGVFGEQLASFGKAIVDFSDEVTGKVDSASVESAASAGMTLAELSSKLPKQGGTLQSFFGEQNLDIFGDQLVSFGKAIAKFSNVVSGNIDTATVESAATAGLTLSELANKLPESGGFLQRFLGEQDLSLFGAQLEAFGHAIANFSKAVSNGNIDPEAVTAASVAGSTMAELAKTLPSTGGLVSFFTGSSDMATFGQELELFGKGFARYASYIKDVKPEVVTTTSNAANSIVKLANSLPDNKLFSNETTLGDFGKQLSKFGAYFATYYDHISGINAYTLSTVVNEIQKLINMADSMANVDSSAMSNFGSALSKLGKSGVDEFIKAFTDANGRVSNAISTMLNNLISSANAYKGKMTSSFTAIVNDGLTGMQSKYSSFTATGKTFVTSLINGVKSQQANAKTAFKMVMESCLASIKSSHAQFTGAGKECMMRFAEGVKANSKLLNSSFSMNEAISDIRNNYNNFYNAGKYLVEGFAKGIDANTYKASARAKAMAAAASNAAKRELDEHSPSRVGYEIGDYFGVGFVNGISNNVKRSYNIGSSMAISASDGLKNGLVSTDEIGERLVDGISEGIESDMTAEEVAAQKAQNIASIFQEEFDKLDMADTTADLESQLTGQAVDAMARYERQVARAQLALSKYETMLKHVGQTATETQEACNSYLETLIDLQQDSFDHSVEWIEERKNASELNLIEEYAAWKRVQSRYLEGTEQRIQADEELLRVQEEIKNATEDYYNDLKTIQDDAESRRTEIDQEYEDERTRIKEEANEERLRLDQEYADKTQEINDQLIADIEAAEKEYEDAVSSRSDSLYDAYGLFDAVSAGESVSGDTLMNNLKGQLEAFESWTNNINSLADKGIDEALLEELREMGPSSAAEIEALNSMSDEQLNEYVALWKEKHQLAKDQAVLELEGMREETKDTIAQLKEDAEIELEEYRDTWREQIDALDKDTDRQLDELRDNWRQQLDELDEETETKLAEVRDTWMESVLGISNEAQLEFSRMTDNLINTIGSRNKWDQVGINAIAGVLQGIADDTPKLIRGVEDAMQEALYAANYVLGINSPSTEFAKSGRYSIEGYVSGLNKYTYMISNAGEEVGKTALDSLRSTITRITELVDDNIDSQPTIRPVLDLTNIHAGAKKLSTMFSRTKALDISAAVNRRTEETPQNGDSKAGGNVYSFTQNNYSPKALSRTEIYRQTKNQFSAMGRMVTYD